MFKLSACKTAKADCAFVLLAGSISRYRGSPANWSGEPERALCRTLVGGDPSRWLKHQATKFVAKHWLAISSLAHGAEGGLCEATRDVRLQVKFGHCTAPRKCPAEVPQADLATLDKHQAFASTRGCSACRMEETADRDVFAEHIEALHRLLSLQDFDLDVVLGQNL